MADDVLPADVSAATALTQIEAIFTPGRLRDKKEQLRAAIDRGDSLFFEGAADWSIFLTGSERRLSGAAASLDEALQDMLSCLSILADEEPPESEVLFGLTMGEKEEAEAAGNIDQTR